MKQITNILTVFVVTSLCAGRILATGYLYMADIEQYAVYKFTAGGSQSTIGTYLEPSVLAVDRSGDVYVGVVAYGSINEITPSGGYSVFATGLNGPAGLAFDKSGNLFEADGSNNIYKFTPNGTQSTFASGLNSPAGLAFNSSGDLFEADWGSGNIYEFTPGGTRSTFAGGLATPIALQFDASGDLFEADAGSGKIYEFTPGGIRSTFASGLGSLRGLAIDNNDDIFVDEQLPASIIEFTPNGTQSTFASGFNDPDGMAFGPKPTPEPSTLALLGAGALGLLGYGWRRRAAARRTAKPAACDSLGFTDASWKYGPHKNFPDVVDGVISFKLEKAGGQLLLFP